MPTVAAFLKSCDSCQLRIVQLSEHVYPTPSLIAAPRAIELTVIEDDLCLPLAFSAALFASACSGSNVLQRSWQVISCCTSINWQFAKIRTAYIGLWAKA